MKAVIGLIASFNKKCFLIEIFSKRCKSNWCYLSIFTFEDSQVNSLETAYFREASLLLHISASLMVGYNLYSGHTYLIMIHV